MRGTIQKIVAADSLQTRTEFPAPEPMAYCENGRGTWRAVIEHENATEFGLDPIKLNVVLRYGRSLNDVNSLSIIQNDRMSVCTSYVFKRVGLVAEGKEFLRREKTAAFPTANVGKAIHAKGHNAIGIPIRERVEERIIEDAEDDRCWADTQSKCKHGN